MKILARLCAFSVTLVLASCASRSSNKADHATDPQAAVSAGDEEACAAHEGGMGIHGDLSAYTASASGLFHVKVEWSSPLKAASLDNSAKVRFVNNHAHELPARLLTFKLFMPAMGHGSSKGDQIVLHQDPLEPGTWSVEQIYFSMGGAAGEWVVDLEASVCGRTDKARVALPVEVQ